MKWSCEVVIGKRTPVSFTPFRDFEKRDKQRDNLGMIPAETSPVVSCREICQKSPSVGKVTPCLGASY